MDTIGCNIAIYKQNGIINSKALIRFYKDTPAMFNGGCYISVWGKGTRLYFLPASPSKGLFISEQNGIQCSKKDIVASLVPFAGKWKLRFDDTTHYYYIDRALTNEDPENELTEEQEEAITPVKASRAKGTKSSSIKKTASKGKAVKLATPPTNKHIPTADEIVENTLRNELDECLDGDDLAGAKALLKAIRKFRSMREDTHHGNDSEVCKTA